GPSMARFYAIPPPSTSCPGVRALGKEEQCAFRRSDVSRECLAASGVQSVATYVAPTTEGSRALAYATPPTGPLRHVDETWQPNKATTHKPRSGVLSGYCGESAMDGARPRLGPWMARRRGGDNTPAGRRLLPKSRTQLSLSLSLLLLLLLLPCLTRCCCCCCCSRSLRLRVRMRISLLPLDLDLRP